MKNRHRTWVKQRLAELSEKSGYGDYNQGYPIYADFVKSHSRRMNLFDLHEVWSRLIDCGDIDLVVQSPGFKDKHKDNWLR